AVAVTGTRIGGIFDRYGQAGIRAAAGHEGDGIRAVGAVAGSRGSLLVDDRTCCIRKHGEHRRHAQHARCANDPAGGQVHLGSSSSGSEVRMVGCGQQPLASQWSTAHPRPWSETWTTATQSVPAKSCAPYEIDPSGRSISTYPFTGKDSCSMIAASAP